MPRHFHFIVQGYESETPQGALMGVTTIDLVAEGVIDGETEQHVLDRAKSLVEKKFWRVSSVVEHAPELELVDASFGLNGRAKLTRRAARA